MKQLLYTILIVMLFTNSQCTKANTAPEADNPYGLPNATQKGADIFAYLIDGKPQIVRGGIYTLGGSISNDTLSVFGEAGDNNYFENIGIVVVGNFNIGFVKPIDNSKIFILIATNKSCNGFLGGTVIKAFATEGNVQISRADKSNRVISGTFNCRIPITGCDTLKITDGRFDIKY